LTRLAEDGIIKVERNGESGEEEGAVPVSTVAAAASIIGNEIRPEQYVHLRGKRIRLMEASREYGVEQPNLTNWVNYGYIQVLDQGFQRLEIDVADAEYVADVFNRAKELTGSSIRAGWVLKRILT
jgi:hypothetical protein